jgi:hypothetical protein
MARAFQRLFTRLVTLGEGQEDTRRVVDRGELGDDVWSLAQRLAGEGNPAGRDQCAGLFA